MIEGFSNSQSPLYIIKVRLLLLCSTLDLLLAGTSEAVLMIEGFCDFLTEEQLLEVSQGYVMGVMSCGTSYEVMSMQLLLRGHIMCPRGVLLRE